MGFRQNVGKVLVIVVIQIIYLTIWGQTLNQGLVCLETKQELTGHLSELWTNRVSGNGRFAVLETPEVHDVLD